MNTKLPCIVSALTALVLQTATAQNEDPARPQRPSPEEIVAELIVNFDANESNGLDEAEMTLAMQNLREKQRERMAAMREKRGDRPQRPDGQNAQGQRKNKAQVDGNRPRGGRGPQLEHVFSRFDADQSGEIESSELLGLLDQMRQGRSKGPRGPNAGKRLGPPPVEGDES